MHKPSYYIVNGITIYRIVAVALLLFLILTGRIDVFKWLLAVSFFTDAIDGFLARKYKVTSMMGSRMDSIGDDLTFLTASVGIIVLKPEFIRDQRFLIIVLLSLYLLQTAMAFIRYKKISSFHTYLAKCAAIMQGSFFILFFFLNHLPMFFFPLAAAFTIADLVEEIILVLILPQWRTDVKGLYWVLKSRRK